MFDLLDEPGWKPHVESISIPQDINAGEHEVDITFVGPGYLVCLERVVLVPIEIGPWEEARVSF